jgi:hypothetical protein
MVVSVKIISQRDSTDIAERFRQRAAEVRSRAAEKIAEDIVNASPVDTGTYIMAHSAQTNDAGGSARTSKGKTRGQDPQQFKNLALGNLKRSVSKDAILNSSEIFFRNLAKHAPRVENGGWTRPLFGNPNSPLVPVPAYYVYSQARNRAPQHIRDAARELGMETR